MKARWNALSLSDRFALFGLCVNVLLLVLTVFILKYTFYSIQLAKQAINEANTSSQRQLNAQNDATKALNEAVDSLKAQTALLNTADQSLVTEGGNLRNLLTASRLQYKIVESQYDAELALQRARPHIAFTIRTTRTYPWGQLLKPQPIDVPLVAGLTGQILFEILNDGDADLSNPVVTVTALTPGVILFGPYPPSMCPLTGSYLMECAMPYGFKPKSASEFRVGLTLNGGLQHHIGTFTLRISISGENLPANNKGPTVFEATAHLRPYSVRTLPY